MSMFNDISWGSKDNEKECESNARLVSLYAKRFGAGQWSFLGPGSEKKWYSISEDSPQGEWDKMAEKMMLEFAKSRHPVFLATSPLSRGQLKSKGRGRLSIHNYFCNSAQSFRSSRRNARRIRNFHNRTVQPVVGGQSSSLFVPSIIKTEVPLDRDDRAHKDL